MSPPNQNTAPCEPRGHPWNIGGCPYVVEGHPYVAKGDGLGYLPLTTDTRPGCVDTEPMPATPAKWKYKAIFRKDDERVGLWSDVAEIAVG